jgi:hypothetical protein
VPLAVNEEMGEQRNESALDLLAQICHHIFSKLGFMPVIPVLQTPQSAERSMEQLASRRRRCMGCEPRVILAALLLLSNKGSPTRRLRSQIRICRHAFCGLSRMFENTGDATDSTPILEMRLASSFDNVSLYHMSVRHSFITRKNHYGLCLTCSAHAK